MATMARFADAQNLLSDLISRYRSQVDYLAIRLEEAEGTDILLRGDKVETLSEGLSIGGQVRACYKGGWGFASFNRLSTLTEQIEAAIAAARLVGDEETILAPVAPVQVVCQLPLLGTDPRQVPLVQKKDLCSRYGDILRSVDDRIATTSVRYGDSTQRVVLATSDGSLIEQSWIDVEMRFAATARSGETVQTGRETTGSRKAYEDLEQLDEQVRGAAQRAVNALNLPSVKGSTYTVVIDPILSGLFVHEAFGHLSEADFVYENPKMQELLVLGKPLAIPQLNVVDDATMPHLPGSLKYDDEGVPAQRKYLIKDGVLTQRLHSRETAGKMQEQPTGNARALSAAYPPIVRMTNTGIENGDQSFAEMLRGIETGVYAVRMLGGQTNGELFTFAAAEGYMIRNGELAEPVSDVTLSGNVFQTMKDIEAIGNDSVYRNGGCGKGGQSPLPVSVGGPHVRIKNVVVGGR